MLDSSAWGNRRLIWQFARKDIILRYRGSLLGGIWSVLSPLIMLAIYTFVFELVLHAKWSEGSGDTLEYALNLYPGLLIFNWFAECLGRAPKLIHEQPYLVNKVVIPLQTLGWGAAISAGTQMYISMGLWFVACMLSGYPLTPHLILLPLVPILLLPWLLATVWILSSTGVFLRDLSQVLPILITSLMFLSPVLYPIKALPPTLQTLAYLNPLTFGIEALRGLAFKPESLHLWTILISSLTGLLVAFFALWVFKRLSPYFSDLL